MNLTERVIDFLRKRPGRAYCEPCIARDVRTKLPIDRILAVLVEVDPSRQRRGVCASCSKRRPVFGLVEEDVKRRKRAVRSRTA